MIAKYMAQAITKSPIMRVLDHSEKIPYSGDHRRGSGKLRKTNVKQSDKSFGWPTFVNI